MVPSSTDCRRWAFSLALSRTPKSLRAELSLIGLLSGALSPIASVQCLAGARRHAACPSGRSAYRPCSAGTGPRRNPTRPSAWPESPSDRQGTQRLHRDDPAGASKASRSGRGSDLRKNSLNRLLKGRNKRGLKTRSVNPIESMAGSTRSGRVKRCGLRKRRMR